MDLRYVGFGTGFLDVDNDGWEDIFISNGHVLRFAIPFPQGVAQRAQRPVILHGEGKSKFKDVSKKGGTYFHSEVAGQCEHIGRGLALGDLDNDGRCDAVVSHLNEPVVLLQNVCANGNHWLGIELLGKNHRDVVGARIIVKTASDQQTRFAKGGGSYLSARDPRHLFGLGKDDHIEKVTVFWPHGERQEWDGLPVDSYWQLIEGENRPKPHS
jgi:hypothetical protein